MRRAAPANWSNLPNRNRPRFYTAWTLTGHQPRGLERHNSSCYRRTISSFMTGLAMSSARRRNRLDVG